MSGRAPPLIDAVDGLYRRAVESAVELDDAELGRWMEEIALHLDSPLTKAAARALRKAARNARRLARYWSYDRHDPTRLPDWRNGVDEVLGGGGWNPQLALARHDLEGDPSPEAYAEVKRWFRAVHFAEWMEGVSFEEWLASRGP